VCVGTIDTRDGAAAGRKRRGERLGMQEDTAGPWSRLLQTWHRGLKTWDAQASMNSKSLIMIGRVVGSTLGSCFPALRPFRLTILLFVFLATAPAKTRAEGILDFYGGEVINGGADVTVSERTASGTRSVAASIDLSSSSEFGARFGASFPAHRWIGLGLDLGYFEASGSGVDIDAFPFSMFLTLKAPLLATPARPGGRLQPYAMAGVTFHMIDVSVQLEGMGGSAFEGSWPYWGGTGNYVVGPYLTAGLAWQPANRFAVFGEYRHTAFDVGFDTTNSWIFPTMNGRVDASVTTDNLLIGISYRFKEKTPSKTPPK